MSISVNQLTKRFGGQVAVDQISFDIGKGITGFLGPNGAGKSTTMKMITGYLSPDNGTIEVSGMRMHEQNTEAKKKIGYLPESNPLYPDMYVQEYLGFLAGVHRLPNKNVAIDRAINMVGLNPESHKKIGQLSKGYKQRVGLAATLIHDPEVLILDEPTSGLDPNQIMEIRNVIRGLAKDKIILFSTHIMQEVEMLCSRVIIISKGKIVADSSLENLRKEKTEREYILIEFREEIQEQILFNIGHVISVARLEKKNAFKLETKNPDELRQQIMKLSVEKGLNIISLQNETHSLESVFQSLTLPVSGI